MEYKKVISNECIKSNQPSFCISPYKTGTTYVSGLYSGQNNVKHEPMHYTTLKHIESPEFLKKRSAHLNLDLECSGFFSLYIKELRLIFPHSPFLFVARDPASWISSVISYFTKLDGAVYYNYVLRMFFDPITTYPIEKFDKLRKDEQSIVIKNLLEFWIHVYSSALNDELSLIVKIENIDSKASEIANFLNLKSTTDFSAWKRVNRSKSSLEIECFVNIDPYKEIVNKLGYSL